MLTLVFSLGAFAVKKNKCAYCENIEAIDDVLEMFFLNFFTWCKKFKSTFAKMCVQELRHCDTNCTLLRR